MSDPNTRDACPYCGGTATEALVHYGSYTIRCAVCKQHTMTTSWGAVGPRWNSYLSAFEEGSDEQKPVVEGIGSEIYRKIGRIAATGRVLILNRPSSNTINDTSHREI